MGKHRAPDPDEPTGEPSDDFSEPHDFGDLGGYREPDDVPPAAQPDTGGIPAPRFGEHPAARNPDDQGYFDYPDPSDRDEHREDDLQPANVDTPDDFPDFPRGGQEPPLAPPPPHPA